ncbi:MAG: radical SAM family heme chaperone HemW [Rubripirellula sp.]
MALDPETPIPPGGWPTPRAAYLHVPFCRHRCGYCNFSVIANRDDLIDRFLTAIDQEVASLDFPTVDTIFIGGGTPTHLESADLERFLAMVRSRFDLAPDCELTVEANPEDIIPGKLALLADHGINRISLGVQSFHDKKLSTLERGHTGTAAQETIQLAAETIANVSIDLIFGAPGETLEQWGQDLETALALPIQHLSTYALTFEKGTSFWSRQNRGELAAGDEDQEIELYSAAQQRTQHAGLQQYEVSSFARDGRRCRHNLAYWDGQGWYAAGPGAARFANGLREVNHRSTLSYLKRIEHGDSPTAESEAISLEQYARERAAFGIRLLDGIDLGQISETSGVDLTSLCGEAISKCVNEGLLQQVKHRFALTARGIHFADTVASRLL